MGKLIYSLNVSVDGFIETQDHSLEWTIVDDELHTFFNEQMRTTDASLYGRRLYETMATYWPTGEDDPAGTDVVHRHAGHEIPDNGGQPDAAGKQAADEGITKGDRDVYEKWQVVHGVRRIMQPHCLTSRLFLCRSLPEVLL